MLEPFEAADDRSRTLTCHGLVGERDTLQLAHACQLSARACRAENLICKRRLANCIG